MTLSFHIGRHRRAVPDIAFVDMAAPQLSSTLGLMPMSEDGSNGYEGIASIYVAGRGTRPLVGDAIGAATVRAWAQAFPPGATVLDLGSGPGEPSTRILQEAGLATYAVDASSAMVAAFRERFPGVPIEQNTVEASEFFDRTLANT